ncbi:(R)-mandelonitrile lyase [Streptoalloteichus hindustanus]|uniref:Cupin domain protein n=1 Tax=Streptoalloteichus hindustanus TaxID=2017 RepID=A0A1M5EJU1_STRHI|nr:cupin domain-containing protein [Streptoalloteichus hindustanus]SHF79477.1 Cupin domain protein [Streptoalloteichus hindustanus]
MWTSREHQDAEPAPPGWVTGDVWLHEVVVAEPPSRLRAHSVRFAPGARTCWHRHPHGQLLHVTEGVGLVQRAGGPVEEIHAGHTVWIEPGEWHWHGATPHSSMTHLAVQEAGDDGVEAERGAPVGDAEYPAHEL